MAPVHEVREFDARADTIGAIRGWVQEALLRHGASDPSIDAAVLCTSELATNALLHADGPIGVSLDLGDMVRVAVGDATSAPPRPKPASVEDDGGRGLLLVGLFADQWGFDLTDDGKTVWFELSLRRPDIDLTDRTVHGRRHSDSLL